MEANQEAKRRAAIRIGRHGSVHQIVAARDSIDAAARATARQPRLVDAERWSSAPSPTQHAGLEDGIKLRWVCPVPIVDPLPMHLPSGGSDRG